MKKLFTDYLFILFILPIFIFVVGVFLTPSSGVVDLRSEQDAVQFDPTSLGDSFKNSALFFATYTIFFFSYFVVFLIKKSTNYRWSILHFSSFMLNFILLSFDAENAILLVLTLCSCIFFILNIFKTSRKNTINHDI